MTAQSSVRARILLESIADEALRKFPTLAQTPGFSAVAGIEGSPTLLLGTGATDTDSVFIRIAPSVQAWAKDVLGNAAQVYGPLVAAVVTETASTALVGGSSPVRDWVQSYLAASGLEVVHYNTAHATGPSEAGITGTPVSDTVLDTKWPGMPGNQQ